MFLYHGSFIDFKTPDPSKGKRFRDFGVGFYLAENINDSLSISVKRGSDGILYTYDFDLNTLKEIENKFNLLIFHGFEEEWGRFIYENRIYGYKHPYDLVIGQTAGGKINDLFLKWNKTKPDYEEIKKELIQEASKTTFGTQWCITNPQLLKYFTLDEKENIERG